MRLLTGIAFGLVLSTALATPATAIEPDAPDQLLTRLDAVGIEVQKRLAAPFRNVADGKKREHGALVAFYTEHEHELVWVDEMGPTEKARQVIAELKRAGDYGLNAEDYSLPQLGEDGAETSYQTQQLAEIELKISRAALAYARHARGGRITPSKLSKYLDPTLELPEPLDAMEAFAKSSDVAVTLRDYHPKHPQFDALRQKLLETRGGAGLKQHALVPKGPLLRPGQRHPQVALVRKRLDVPVRIQDGAPASDPEVYDSKLEDAVKAFQKRRGLRAEGIIGPATRRAMNVRPKNPVKKILTNMERWRWVPQEIGKLHVRVNVPEFRIRVVEDGKAIHTERVVVGKVKNQTPIFSDEMERVVFN
ncbi:MAG: peptidoglycan-binding protein, partial [Methyloligellaceae bacterium]